MALPTGSEGVCFDATPLVTFNRIEKLEVLETLFSGCAVTPDVVKNKELIKRLDLYPENQRIQDAGWLTAVKVDQPKDTAFVARLLALWGSKPDRDEGEAEAIALCRRHGWTAVIDDAMGRSTALHYGINCVYTVTALIASAALSIEGAPSRREAWELHQEADEKRGKKARAMPIENKFRPAFMMALKAVRKHWQAQGEPPWPVALADPKLDEIVEEAVKRQRARLT